MTREDFDFGLGEVVFWDLDISETVPLESQTDSLKEDLALIDYGLIVIDVGWRPSFSPKGEFIVFIVENSDWDSPVAEWRVKSIVDLKQRINEGIKIAQQRTIAG